MIEHAPSASRTAEFTARGLVEVRDVIDAQLRGHLEALDLEDEACARINHDKGLWKDPQVRKLALGPRLRATLDELFEDAGYYLWGAQLVERAPGVCHPWHCDIETASEGFVSVWLAVTGAGESGITVIEGSHRVGKPVQAVCEVSDPARADPDGVGLLEAARASVPEALVVRHLCHNGDGIAFDGRLWHGTWTGSTARRALLLQYGRADRPVRWPKSLTGYPFEYRSERSPVVLPIRGSVDPVLNLCLVASSDGSEVGAPPASVAARPRLAAGDRAAWQRFPYFELSSPIMKRLTCHASVLRPGFMPHLPHDHDDEEILLVLQGTVDLFTQVGDGSLLQRVRAGTGDWVYYPSGHRHTIANAVDDPAGPPATYLMFRWSTGQARRQAASYVVRRQDYASPSGARTFAFDRPSSGLDALHFHIRSLPPGRSLPHHVDRYDGALVVLVGELTMLDRTLGPGGVFYSRAGELHNTANQGDGPCLYLVFEFKLRAS